MRKQTHPEALNKMRMHSMNIPPITSAVSYQITEQCSGLTTYANCVKALDIGFVSVKNPTQAAKGPSATSVEIT